ncbi:putative HicB family RNase H-like nuclease [Agromyces terreus]|uniref:HicB family RNase H-like nuclease n=1 Tax=Agromyces terreus TaxID=424795 RepID=A0A9X2KCF8_9MICO|nr:ribbon-helix-helix domain-containing protein [Agromyces terreus]MCP2371321.1 putative HicB family RNase H-like nuclease [Agromyces terreus]
MNTKARREFRVTPGTEFVDVETEDVIYHGQALSEGRVEAIVEDVRRANLIPGGKSLNGDGTHSRRLTLRVPDELYDVIEATAEERHSSVSKVAREALEEWFRKTAETTP